MSINLLPLTTARLRPCLNPMAAVGRRQVTGNVSPHVTVNYSTETLQNKGVPPMPTENVERKLAAILSITEGVTSLLLSRECFFS